MGSRQLAGDLSSPAFHFCFRSLRCLLFPFTNIGLDIFEISRARIDLFEHLSGVSFVFENRQYRNVWFSSRESIELLLLTRRVKPEKLYREKWLVAYLVVCVLAFVGLMFVQIPALYDWFNVAPSALRPLWRM